MRVAFAHFAIVVISLLTLCGCRGNSSGKSWGMPWGRNSGTVSESTAGPELPSAGAMQDGGAPGNYNNYNAPPPANYDQQGAPYDQAGAYGQAGAYDPSATAGAYPPPTGAYPGYGDPNAAAAGAYGAQPGGPGYPDAAAGPAAGYPDPAATANSVAPQAGPYAAAGAGAYPSSAGPSAYPSAGSPQPYPQASTAVVPPYQNGSPVPAQDGSGYTVNNPYVANPAAGGAAPPTDYAATQPSATSSSAAADPNGTGAYPSAGQNAAGNEGAAVAGGYQPGNTGYQPGNTGYAPPGVEPYQTPGAVSVASTTRSYPYYRPGSTSDYSSSGASQAPAGSVDRYGVPSTASTPNWPQGH
jgi:hypothetical protein